MSYIKKDIKKLNRRLRQKVLLMVKEDQKMRKGSKLDPHIDKKNTSRMKLIIKKYGWPGKSSVGEKGSDGAWLLVQHADHDLRFQKKCLRLIQEAIKKGEAKKSHLAYLTDRILTHEKKEQLYGTQFRVEEKANKLSPYPIYDTKNLDKRRKNMGLSSFREYKKLADKSFKRFRASNYGK